jgi:hypothetical protein
MEHGFEFRRGDAVLNLRGERDWVEAMAARYLPMLLGEAPPTNAAGRAADLPAPPQRAPHVHKNITLLEFVRLKEVSDPSDLVLALAYYLEKYEYLPNYDLVDLQPYFAELELDEATVEKALRHHTHLSLLVDDGGRYSLSYSGEQRVKYGDFPESPAAG